MNAIQGPEVACNTVAQNPTIERLDTFSRRAAIAGTGSIALATELQGASFAKPLLLAGAALLYSAYIASDVFCSKPNR